MPEDDVDLQVGEYIVEAIPILKLDPFYKDSEGNLVSLGGNFTGITMRTKVRSYNQATTHLLSVAERIRNYAAFSVRFPIPLNVTMQGKRKNQGNWFPSHAFFDGATNLPMMDGGIGEISFFITRFGPHEGSPPPSSALSTIDNWEKWAKGFNEKLKYGQHLLERIDIGSRLDTSVSSIGESFWTKSAKDKVISRWRAIESICKLDYGKSRVNLFMLQFTINKRSDGITREEFDELKKFRNDSVHEWTSFEDASQMHKTADRLYWLGNQIVDSSIAEHIK